MKPYGRDDPVKFPGKREWNIKSDGKKLKSWWVDLNDGACKKRERKRAKEDILKDLE